MTSHAGVLITQSPESGTSIEKENVAEAPGAIDPPEKSRTLEPCRTSLKALDDGSGVFSVCPRIPEVSKSRRSEIPDCRNADGVPAKPPKPSSMW